MAEEILPASGTSSGRDYLSDLKTLLQQTRIPFEVEKEPYEYPIAGEPFYRLDVRLTVGSVVTRQAYIAAVMDGHVLALILTWQDDQSYAQMDKSVRSLRID